MLRNEDWAGKDAGIRMRAEGRDEDKSRVERDRMRAEGRDEDENRVERKRMRAEGRDENESRV